MTDDLMELVMDASSSDHTRPYMTHNRFSCPVPVFELIRSLLIMDVPDGETSSGQQKYRTYTDDEAIERAIAICDKMVDNGLAVKAPSYDELKINNTVGFM